MEKANRTDVNDSRVGEEIEVGEDEKGGFGKYWANAITTIKRKTRKTREKISSCWKPRKNASRGGKKNKIENRVAWKKG